MYNLYVSRYLIPSLVISCVITVHCYYCVQYQVCDGKIDCHGIKNDDEDNCPGAKSNSGAPSTNSGAPSTISGAQSANSSAQSTASP